jgi:hypothetical protein
MKGRQPNSNFKPTHTTTFQKFRTNIGTLASLKINHHAIHIVVDKLIAMLYVICI